MRIIDFHTHVLPWESRATLPGSVAQWRSRLRSFAQPVSRAMHEIEPLLRFLPPIGKRIFDEIAALAPTPFLLLESDPDDLREAMEEGGVERAIIIASPPYSENDFILELSRKNPALVPAVLIPPSTPEPEVALRAFAAAGARILEVPPSMDGLTAGAPHYARLLVEANALKLPVILHTGCFHNHTFYKKPEASRADLFEGWFSAYPETTFVLAHMNFHEPEKAIELAERHPNVYVDTSWQPTEVIAEAVRRIGSQQILYGSDWPLLGGNMKVGVDRIWDAVRSEMIDETDAENIFFRNAETILDRIPSHAETTR